jgi:D-glycerate 3-kinase
VVTGPLDVVLFEGWMLGFRPHEDEATAAAVAPHLAAVNALLPRYVAEWDSFADAWLVFKIADPGFVYK